MKTEQISLPLPRETFFAVGYRFTGCGRTCWTVVEATDERDAERRFRAQNPHVTEVVEVVKG